jgi:hypothetical protein
MLNAQDPQLGGGTWSGTTIVSPADVTEASPTTAVSRPALGTSNVIEVEIGPPWNSPFQA